MFFCDYNCDCLFSMIDMFMDYFGLFPRWEVEQVIPVNRKCKC